MNRPRRYLGWLAAGAMAGLLFALPRASRAVDDTKVFLEALRQRGYFDTALDYLDSLRTNPRVGDDFKATIDYEAGAALIEASKGNRVMANREKQLAEAKLRIERFLQEHANHEKAQDATRQLANLLVERGKIKLAQSELAAKKPTEKQQLQADARGLFGEAGKVFAAQEKQALEEHRKFAPKLEKGTPEYEARERVRQRLLAARIALATVPYEIARTHPEKSEDRKKSLEAAAQKFGELYEKYSAMLAGLYARMEQARCYRELGQTAKVFEVVEELLTQPDDPSEFRVLKTKALLVLLEAVFEGKAKDKYEDALAKYQAWEKSSRGHDDLTPDGLAMKYHAAKIAWEAAKAFKKNDPKEGRFYRERIKMARELFKHVERFAGEWQAPSRLALQHEDFGGKDTEDAEPANFAEARERTSAILGQVSAIEAAAKEKGGPVPEKQQEELKTSRREALKYFRMALRMKPRDLKLDDLNAVRYYLAYLYWACEDYYDAAVVGEFLARAYPESAGAKAGAKIAMAAYGKLFNQAPEDDRGFESGQMLKLAEHVGKTWANEPDADDAWLTIVRTAVINRDLPQALEYLKRIPDASPRRGEAELMVGQSIWNRYLQGMKQVAEEQTPEDKGEMKKKLKLQDDAELAEKTLEAGVARMRKIVDAGDADVSYPLVASVLSLGQVLLETGQAEKAVKWLDDPKVGAMTLVAANAPVTQRGSFPVETYKAALRAYVGSLDMEKAEKAAAALESRIQEEDEAAAKLTRIYISLGRELQNQLERLRDENKTEEVQKVTKGFETFLTKIADREKGTTFNSLFWVADTFFSMGSGFDPPGSKKLTAEAKNYYRKAADTYEKILKRFGEPGFAAPKGGEVSIKVRLARAYARLGRDEKDTEYNNFKYAMGLLLEILKEKNTMVDAQKEAALTYQAWGDVRPEYYQFAIAGSTKHKELWGWGQLSKRVMNNANFKDLFYEARYNIAVCRFKQAMTKDGAEKTKTLQKALSDITVTQTLYPDLGGKEWYDKFNDLFKKIQKALGEKVTGLPPSDVKKPAGK